MDNSFIDIVGVSKSFGGVKAVDDISLSVHQGEFFSLLGPSGCGKTTLLRILGGLETPGSGRVMIDGQDITDMPAHLRPTNMVFQNYAIFPHLNVEQNVAYGLRQQKLSRDEQIEKVSAALAMVKLEGFEKRGADEMSGGQKQRVALARALIKRPKVLLLDEPLGALDKKLREEMQIELRMLQQQVGITFVFVTHDQEEALTLSDRVAVMGEGRILQMDSPRQIYERPKSREVADFIGQMNLLSGVVESVGDKVTVKTQTLGDVCVENNDQDVAVGDAVTLAIRPENLKLRSASAPGAVRVTLAASAFWGHTTYYRVVVTGAEGESLDVAQQDYSGSERAGDEAWLGFDPGDLLLLKS
ncbi:MAG: ABC transporter ATP-binding protein [Arenicellales bacterium]